MKQHFFGFWFLVSGFKCFCKNIMLDRAFMGIPFFIHHKFH